MNISLLARKIYRLVKSGSAKAKDYKNYARYLADAPASYSTALFNLTVDLELAWSRARKNDGATTLAESLRRGRLARKNFPALLSLLDSYGIPATFAIVGHVALDNCSDHNQPPKFHPDWINGDWYDIDPKSDDNYYGLDLVKELLKGPGHEIASHSFSHVDFSDEFTGADVAAFEIAESRRVIEKLGAPLDTFVFPNNRPAFVDILAKNNFTIYRNSKNGKIARDQYGCWQFPVGIWISPNAFGPKETIELVKTAIQKQQLVNFWFHLHEFAGEKQLREFFEPVLRFVSESARQGLIRPDTMRGIVKAIR